MVAIKLYDSDMFLKMLCGRLIDQDSLISSKEERTCAQAALYYLFRGD
jgi:hypothetical protein